MHAAGEQLRMTPRFATVVENARNAIARAKREIEASLSEMLKDIVDLRDVIAFEIEKTDFALLKLAWDDQVDREKERALLRRKADLAEALNAISADRHALSENDLIALLARMQSLEEGRERSPHDPARQGIMGS